MTDMTEPVARSPLETLVLRTPVEDARSFFTGSLSIRKMLESQEDSRLGLPLRGAMPMFWAADGTLDIEEPAVPEAMLVEIPVGTYHYTDGTGTPKVRSPSRRAKQGIIDRALSEAGVGEGDSLSLLDEIQGGGTVTQLVRGSLNYARRHGLKLPLHLIAAEDTRVASSIRKGSYRRISTNQREGVAATVVRIPLIGCDRDNLLDKVVLPGESDPEHEAESRFDVTRNDEAELIFRTLGSMTRHAELGHDVDYIVGTFDPLVRNDEVADKLEDWVREVTSTREDQ